MINENNINSFLNKYIDFVNNISNNNNYQENIKHVLYLIIPAFVVKYGFKYENLILKAFNETPIVLNNHEMGNCTAFFSRIIKENKEGLPKYYTQKLIVLNNYNNYSLIDLLDNIAHEFNHVINSLINEIKYDDESVSMRTGLSYITYNINDLSKPSGKSEDVILEEIINTKQTEDVLKIIKSFSNYKIENVEFENALYAVNSLIKDDYSSNAYFLQSYICKELMRNKTFIPTIENLRLNGNTDDIEHWFDDITNIKKSYQKLIALLNEIVSLEEKTGKNSIFKKYYINKIRQKMRDVQEIVNEFENNCIFK
ncbi:MAG: hypothetical protein IKQ35_00910 [Bacilli bacterium]|nr:hypothetical protein [Bacilli bacterium]